MIRVDSEEVFPAEIDGGNKSAFCTTKIALVKPRWLSDDAASSCGICKSKFNQIRRRHHCRCCGKVYCNKCCLEKVPLPQYELEAPERVCNQCVPVSACVTMGYSNDPTFHMRSVTGLAMHCRDKPSSVIALGGAHTLVFLAKKKNSMDINALTNIANGLHSLSRYSSLIPWLSKIGVLSALSHILTASANATSTNTELLIIDALGALRIFAKTSDQLKVEAIDNGCLPSILKLCNYESPSISLTATTTLCLLSECPQNHYRIINQENAIRSMLLKITGSSDEQVTEHVLRILVALSCGNNDVKHTITSEDASCGSVISKALELRPRNQQITASAASLIANLATNDRDQVLLQNGLHAVLSNLPKSYPDYVTLQLVRAVSNFSEHVGHAGVMLSNISNIVKFLNNTETKISVYTARCITNLLKHRNRDTITSLCRNGVQDYLLRLTELDNVMDKLAEALNNFAPSIMST